jgi:hypothetical protein
MRVTQWQTHALNQKILKKKSLNNNWGSKGTHSTNVFHKILRPDNNSRRDIIIKYNKAKCGYIKQFCCHNKKREEEDEMMTRLVIQTQQGRRNHHQNIIFLCLLPSFKKMCLYTWLLLYSTSICLFVRSFGDRIESKGKTK